MNSCQGHFHLFAEDRRESPRRDKKKIRWLLAGVKSDEMTRWLDWILVQVWNSTLCPRLACPSPSPSRRQRFVVC
jgi:hypothetical protein